LPRFLKFGHFIVWPLLPRLCGRSPRWRGAGTDIGSAGLAAFTSHIVYEDWSLVVRDIADMPTPTDLDLIKKVRESAQYQREMSPDIQNRYLAYYILLDGMVRCNQNLSAVSWLACEGSTITGFPVLSVENRQHLVSVIEASARGLLDLAAVIRDYIPTGDEHTQYL
jgi:hypothetical protein